MPNRPTSRCRNGAENVRNRRPHGRRSKVLTALAALVVLGLVVVVAEADERTPASAAAFDDLDAMRSRARAQAASFERWRRTPKVAAERRRSRLVYRQLGSRGVLQAAKREFPDLVARPTDPLNLGKGVRLVRVVDDYHAMIERDGKRALLESTLPLRQETRKGAKRVDLGVRSARGGFQLDNPLMPLTIAKTASAGVRVDGHGIAIAPVGVANKGGKPVGGAVVYPNTYRDGDTAIRPQANSVRIFTILRSPASPERLDFKVKLQPGDKLKAIAPGAPSYAIWRGRRVLGTVAPPTAVDAQGKSVEVRQHKVGRATLRLQVIHRAADVAYPVAVDPMYQWDDWTENRDWKPTPLKHQFQYWPQSTSRSMATWLQTSSYDGYEFFWTYHVPQDRALTIQNAYWYDVYNYFASADNPSCFAGGIHASTLQRPYESWGGTWVCNSSQNMAPYKQAWEEPYADTRRKGDSAFWRVWLP
jgi:hypothetical protein